MSQLRDLVASGSSLPLRIAASDVIIRDYLPNLLKSVDPEIRMRIVLREAPSQDLAGLVRDGDVDLAIGLLSRHVDAGRHPLVEKMALLPMVVHVPPSHARAVKKWSDLLRILRSGDVPRLVGLPQNNLIMQHVALSLRRKRIEWLPTLEVSSFGHVPAYVKLDFGFGFGLAIPGETKRSRIISIPPEQIPPLALGIWHRETLEPAAARLLSLIRDYASANLR